MYFIFLGQCCCGAQYVSVKARMGAHTLEMGPRVNDLLWA